MRWFRRNKKVAADEAGWSEVLDEAVKTGNEEAIWFKAQHLHDDRFLRLQAHASNWRRFAFMCLAVCALCVGGLISAAHQSKFIPFLVEVDKLGRTLGVRSLTSSDVIRDRSRLVYREQFEFIESCRTRTMDAAANNRFLEACFLRLTGAAREYVRSQLRERRTYLESKNLTVLAEAKNLIPVSDTLWTVEWLETTYNAKGDALPNPEYWKANVTFDTVPEEGEQAMARNPIGFKVSSIAWSKQIGENGLYGVK